MSQTIALYPGTFDPIHYGHLDIAQRAAALFDHLIVGVYQHSAKSLLFSIKERVTLAQTVLADFPNISVQAYAGLTVKFADQCGAQVLVRGLRVISDFELEYQMAHTNQQLSAKTETICLMTHHQHAFLSSSVLKEVFMVGGDISQMAHPAVITALARKREQLGADNRVVRMVSLRD